MKFVRQSLFAAALVAGTLVHLGCEIDSADEFVRNVPTDFSGYYVGRDGGVIVSENSGAAIKSLDLRQTGDELDAVDNNGAIWRGSLGEVRNGTSSFVLEGRTSTGVEGTFSGTFSSSDGGSSASGTVSSVTGTMQGTYIEPGRFATFYATATIPGTSSGSGGDGGGDGDNVEVSASDQELTVNGETSTLTASGGDGSYSWSVSGGSGSLNSTTGSSVVYTRTASGNNTITVSSDGDTASVTITQP